MDVNHEKNLQVNLQERNSWLNDLDDVTAV